MRKLAAVAVVLAMLIGMAGVATAERGAGPEAGAAAKHKKKCKKGKKKGKKSAAVAKKKGKCKKKGKGGKGGSKPAYHRVSGPFAGQPGGSVEMTVSGIQTSKGFTPTEVVVIDVNEFDTSCPDGTTVHTIGRHFDDTKVKGNKFLIRDRQKTSGGAAESSIEGTISSDGRTVTGSVHLESLRISDPRPCTMDDTYKATG